MNKLTMVAGMMAMVGGSMGDIFRPRNPTAKELRSKEDADELMAKAELKRQRKANKKNNL